MERLTPVEKIWAALQVVGEQRQLWGQDDQIPIPEHKFQEYGLYDIDAVLGGLQRRSVIRVLEEITDKCGLTLPIYLLDEDYPTRYLTVNAEKFDKYYEEVKAQLPELGEEKQELNLEDVLKGAGIEYDTNTGNFKYGRKSGRLSPTNYQGEVLMLLLKNIGRELDLKTIWEAMSPYEKFQRHEVQKIHNTMTNLRRKLGLSTKKLKREHNYYTLIN